MTGLIFRAVATSALIPVNLPFFLNVSSVSSTKYMEKYDCDVDRVYAVTLSAELSGSYNSAVLGMNLYHEEHGEKNIHVFIRVLHRLERR